MVDTEINAEDLQPRTRRKAGGKIILLMITLVVLLAGGGAAYVFLVDPSLIGKMSNSAETSEIGSSALLEPEDLTQTIVPLEEIIINIRDRDLQRILKLKVSIELVDSSDFNAVQRKIPVLLDGFQSHIRGMRASEIEGSRAIYRIKEELISRANVVLHPIRVKNILFAELLMQ